MDISYAVERLYCALNMNIESAEHDLNCDYLSEMYGRKSKRKIWWYMDGMKEGAVYDDTAQFLTDDEIKEELA